MVDLKEDMTSQKDALLKKLALDYPEGTSFEKIIVPSEAGQEILMNTLGTRSGKEIRGMGFGRYRKLGSSKITRGGTLSACFEELEQQVATERAPREGTDRIVLVLVNVLNANRIELSQELEALLKVAHDDDIGSP